MGENKLNAIRTTQDVVLEEIGEPVGEQRTPLPGPNTHTHTHTHTCVCPDKNDSLKEVILELCRKEEKAAESQANRYKERRGELKEKQEETSIFIC